MRSSAPDDDGRAAAAANRFVAIPAGARCHGDQAGRRTVFTRWQVDAMEARFIRQSFLTREERIDFAEQIRLTERQILVWFQNRR